MVDVPDARDVLFVSARMGANESARVVKLVLGAGLRDCHLDSAGGRSFAELPQLRHGTK